MIKKIISWNVNSINARYEHFKQLLEVHQPDIVCLQELKCEEQKFPHHLKEEYNYNIAISGQKSYNGVAIFSKTPIEDVSIKLDGYDTKSSARFIEVLTYVGNKPAKVISVYVPNGSEISSDKFKEKLLFLDCLKNHLSNLLVNEENIVVAGDLNVAPFEQDVYSVEKLYNQIGFHIEERTRLHAIMALGYHDSLRILHPDEKIFSWWDYRASSFLYDKGMRIDSILLSSNMADSISKTYIDRSFRKLEKPSDHAPVVSEFL